MSIEAYSRFYLWISKHRRAAFVVCSLIAAACIFVVTHIGLEEDILSTLPERDQLVDEYKYTLRKFRQIDRVYIDVGATTADGETLTKAADDYFAGISTNPAIIRVMYRFEMSGQRKVVDFLTGALPNLFTESDAVALLSKLDAGSVREYLTTMRRKLAGPEGMVLKDVVAADPIGMSGLVVAKVLPLQTGFGDARVEDGHLVSGDGKHILIMAEPAFASSNSKDSEQLVMDLLKLARDVETRYPATRVAITGGHRMTVDNARLIKGDATRCIFLGMTAMLVLCLTAYRRRWLALLTFLPSLFGTLVAGVAIAIGWGTLSAIAMGFATIAIGITVDYAIYVIYHLDNAAGLERAKVGRHVGELFHPIVVGALTTVAAFLVMATSPMRGYQQIGVFGAVGVVFSAIFALTILPQLVPVPKQSGQQPLWLTRGLERFHAWRERKTWLLLPLVVVVTVASISGVRRLRFEGDIAKLNGITESTRLDEEHIRETWGDAMGMTLVVARGATEDEALAKNDHAAKVLADDANVKGVYSLSSVCPSLETQRANIRRWQSFWTGERKESLRSSLQMVGGELGFRSEAFASFWTNLESTPSQITLESFRGTPLEQALSERSAMAPSDCAVSTLLKLEDRAKVGDLRGKLPEVIVLDHKAFADHIAELARNGLGHFVFWTALIVTLIVWRSLSSLEMMFATLIPIAIGALWTFGAMGWLGLPIDMMNSIFIIFIIGAGEDYSIFLVTSKLDAWRGKSSRLAATSASVMISALTTIFGFAVLVFANHPVLFSMGTTVLIGMGGTFIATLILTPLMMDLLLFRDPPRGAPRGHHILVALFFGLQLAVCQFCLYCVIRPVLHLFSPRDAARKLRRLTGHVARLGMQAVPYGKLEYKDISPATFEKPAILISNHQSAVDVMLIVSLPGDIRQTAKKRVFDTPILGIGCKVLGHVQVEPDDPATTLQRCREKLADGASVHFYPEGTRSSDGFVRRFHRGAFELAIETKQDVLPVIICDSCTAVPRDAYWIEPGHVTVRALSRVTPDTFDYSLGAPALMRHCEAIVREGLQHQLDQTNTQQVVRRKVQRLYRYQGTYVEHFARWKMKLDPMFTALDGVVPRKGKILDLGCGYGLVTNWLAQFTDGRSFVAVDYDADKVRVAKRTAPQHPRIEFHEGDIFNFEYPQCDTVLLLDVLHYWVPEKQDELLRLARAALRPGGRLILRDAARASNAGHARTSNWEKFATRLGMNRTVEGLHFRTLEETIEALQRVGFTRWELVEGAGRDSNVMLVAEF